MEKQADGPAAQTANSGQQHKDDAEDAVASAPPEVLYSTVSKSTRTYLTYLLGIIITLSTLTATIYFPLIPLLSTTFGTSVQAINLTVTVYAVCQAVSPGVFASLADAVGRRPVLLVLILVYLVASLGLALNKNNYAALITLRGLQSMGGSATTPIAYGIVADVAVPADRGAMLGPLLSTCNAISAVGPVIGGAVANSTDGYRWVFLALLFLAATCFLVAGFTLPETARNIVGNGSVRPTGVWCTWSDLLKMRKVKPETMTAFPTRVSFDFVRVLDSVRIMFEPDTTLVLWMIGSSYSAYYTFQVIIPVVFNDIYHYDELKIGLAFLPGLAGMTMGGMVAGKLSDRNYRMTAREHNVDPAQLMNHSVAEFPIEVARYRHFIPAITLQTCLIVGYGWAVQYRAHVACPLILQFMVCAMSTSLSHPASTLLVDIHPDKSSTAYASGQIVRCGLSAIWAAAIQPLTDAVGRGWCLTIFSLIIGSSGVVVVLLSRTHGMKWRQKRSGRLSGPQLPRNASQTLEPCSK